jgi:hypothetical protein
MRRSSKVTAPLLATAALLMAAGCQRPEMQRCVDEQNMVVDDDLCHAVNEQRTLGSTATPSTYRYYYGGTGSTESGTVAQGGSYEPDQGHTYKVANSPTSRGGFGSFGNTYAPWIVGAAALLLLWRAGE